MKWAYKLEQKGIEYEKFIEPDIGNQTTAVSCLSDGKIFSNLRLMK